MTVGKWTRVRVAGCGIGFAVLFFAIGTRAFDLQVNERDKLRALAEEQYLREIELPPRRGRILDKNNAELASSAEVDSIYCNPRRLIDPADAALRLARVLSLDHRELEKKLNQRRFFAWVKRRVTPEEAAAVRELALPGVAAARESRRFYPNRTLAATVMGHAGADGRGLDGVELAFEKALRGTSSSVQSMRDALGRELLVDGVTDTDSGAGSDVALTIDRYLTFVTERALAEAVARTRAKGATAVVMDPRTGDVLAMASVPTYNPNDPGDSAAAGARNRAVTDTYEPGSTMKTFTIAAAIDAGVVKPDDRIDCQLGLMSVGKYQIHDTHPHGVLTVAEVFKFSSNIGTAKIARRLGRDAFSGALARFGFGRATALGIPGERSGIVRNPARWGEIGLANIAFGQGLTVTALQMVSGVSAIANGGVHHPARIVARIVHADGSEEQMKTAAPTRVMSESAARTMITIMRGVTEPGGTAKQAAIPGYPVAGKTGTAQKVAHGRYDPDKWVASFVGFAPAQDPRVTIIVVMDEPQGVHLGGAVAAPVFKEIGEQALRYLHVPPEEGTPSVAPTTAVAVGRAAPVEVVDEQPGSDVATQDEDGLVAESLADGESAPAPVDVPNFRGMSLADAIHAARRAKVELDVEGSGVAVSQEPAPGPGQQGVACHVRFERKP